MRSRHARFPLLAFLALGLFACGGAPQGPHVRVATAQPSDLEAVKDSAIVWYDLEPGDTVPVSFALLGDVEGGSRPGQALLRARRRVSIVLQKGQPAQFSFDGKTFATANSTKFVMAVLPGHDGKGAQLGWLLYVGESGDVDKAIEVLLKESKSGG